MPSSILSIGQSALQAAQIGLATTGHNIANANTPGYSRQIVIQGPAAAQDFGSGFVGKGTQVLTVQRVYDEYLNNQVMTAQTSKNALDSYYAQIKQIDNMLGDSTTGVSSSLQDFFSSIQGLASNPNGTVSAGARQAVLSSAQALAARFQALGGQLDQIRQGVNDQIGQSVTSINSYAQQIASLNDAIEKAEGTAGDSKPANDLLDQRDQLVSELSKQVKVSLVKQGNSYNVFIGNGQPLVVGTQTFNLVATTSQTDLSRAEIGYLSNGSIIQMPESSLSGGVIGGLFDFRANNLDAAQNSLGRVATGLALTFNAQHELGQDQNGALGGAFFKAGAPVVNPSSANTGNGVIGASISNAGALTTSDYLLQVDTAAAPPAPGAYRITRLSDGTVTTFSSFPQTVDGVDFNLASGSPATGDKYLVKPTANGAAGLSVAINDISKIAAAAPIVTAATVGNTGSGKISAGSVSTGYTNATVTPTVTLTYNAGTNKFSGFPATMPVTVTSGGTSTTFAAGTPVTYTDGATISFGGVNFTLSGTPANGDTFTIGQNTNGQGDNRNALQLAALQTSNTLANGTINYQSAYGQLVSAIGSKTHELEVTSAAQGKLLDSAVAAQQAESGVNLDEEAANLLRYQQAYQAAGKVMQTASQLFDLLLTIGQA